MVPTWKKKVKKSIGDNEGREEDSGGGVGEGNCGVSPSVYYPWRVLVSGRESTMLQQQQHRRNLTRWPAMSSAGLNNNNSSSSGRAVVAVAPTYRQSRGGDRIRNKLLHRAANERAGVTLIK